MPLITWFWKWLLTISTTKKILTWDIKCHPSSPTCLKDWQHFGSSRPLLSWVSDWAICWESLGRFSSIILPGLALPQKFLQDIRLCTSSIVHPNIDLNHINTIISYTHIYFAYQPRLAPLTLHILHIILLAQNYYEDFSYCFITVSYSPFIFYIFKSPSSIFAFIYLILHTSYLSRYKYYFSITLLCDV